MCVVILRMSATSISHIYLINVNLCVVCSDLAVDLRMRMGDWFRVVQLLKTGGGAGMHYVVLWRKIE